MWGSPAEAKVFNPNIAKLDTKTVSCHFIGYPDRSKGFCFYTLDRYTKSVETRHAVFLEDKMMRGSMVALKIDLEEKRVYVPSPTIPKVAVQAPIVTRPMTTMCEDLEPVRQEPTEPVIEHERELQQPPLIDVPEVEAQNKNEALRRSKRIQKSAISTDYKVYNIEIVHMEGDPTSYEEAMRIPHSSKWLEAMEDEMKSMSSNDVWDIEEISKGTKIVGYKWVYETKYDSNGNVEKYKARLVAKEFTQREGVDYNETFSPISCRDSFRIIMALVAHFDLELHQMDVKTAFINRDLEEGST
jgi:hypothetical protein